MVLRWLLEGLDPYHVKSPDSDIGDILDRWEKVSSKKGFGNDKHEEEEGHYTPLTLVQEFCCLVATLYGKKFGDKQFEMLGDPQAKSVVRRCAYYGNANMTIEEMKAAIEKEEDVFVFAALYNDNFFWDGKRRAALEGALRGTLRNVYARRC